MGYFHAKLRRSEYEKAKFLICIPGMIPWAERPLPDAVMPLPFQMRPVPYSDVEHGLRSKGWRMDIPAVCQLPAASD